MDEKLKKGLARLAEEMKKAERYKFDDEIEFPIQVDKVETNFSPIRENGLGGSSGDLVSVRLKDKTYLGILVGSLVMTLLKGYDPVEKKLMITGVPNPAIYVPDLKRIVWGAESWWKKIESEDQLKAITDEDIENTWYVKLLRGKTEKS